MEAVDVLRAFWAAMYKWERRAWRLCRPSKATGAAVLDTTPLETERAAIVTKFCTPKRRAYSEGFSCGDPTKYDPTTEDVLEVVAESPRRVVVHTQQRAGSEDRRRYVLLRRGDHWLLDSWQWECDGKWERGII